MDPGSVGKAAPLISEELGYRSGCCPESGDTPVTSLPFITCVSYPRYQMPP